MALENYEVTEIEAVPVQVDASEKASLDIQVTTAKAYPRNLARVKNNSIALATMDRKTAESCSYALPRGGKPITGVSVHLARILAQQYGNIRAEAKVVEITDKQIVSRGTAWDLESNYAVAFEVRRSISGKTGRFSDDMITVTGNAANAIAYRNAVLSVIPKGITDAAYNAAQDFVTGDLSDEAKLIARRKKALDFFRDEYGIKESEVLKMLGKQSVSQINAESIKILVSTEQALKDGDTTVDELMKNIRFTDIQEKKEDLKNKKQNAPDLF
jgi:molybdopterin converting factor small subunit